MKSIKISRVQFAIIALIISNVIWGATSPIFKWALADIEPFTFGFIRFFLASLIVLPFVIHKLKISLNNFLKIAVLAYVGLFLHISYLLFGLELTASINAPIISSSGPVFLILGSIFFLKEKTKRKVIIGTLISLFGVILIILQPILSQGFDGEVIGNILFVLSMLTAVAYTLLMKKFHLPYSIATITFWLFAVTAASYFPFFLWETQGTDFMSTLSTKAVIGILFGAIGTSTIAYVCYNFALRHVVANEVGIFLYVDPIIAVLIAVPLLGEKITVEYIIGSVLVFAGIFIAERRIHFHPLHKLKQS